MGARAEPGPESGRAEGTDDGAPRYPGRRLGYPESGPGSIANPGRRLVALAVDWALSIVIATGLWGFRLGSGGGGESFKPLLIFGVMNLVLVGTAGSTIGHRLLGLQVQRVGGGYAGPLAALVRSVLLCLAVPPLIWDSDERGMHDRAAGTAIRRIR
ncbi:MAG: RDD family protein [Austwickia sp.]|jgi:uncharacterized RDD family membrane protein YckC|nr:RDD family protein [Austwickia sp.]MBK8435481.1 RDD family protein [Austwickia sp.]MBK9100971.1 RDD family protein [Austwickia sp.]